MAENTQGHVLVLGAGIVGVSTAIWLQRAGYEVILIDRDEPGNATSYGNAGILASSSVVPVTGPGLVSKAPAMILDPDSPLFVKWRYLPKLLPWLLPYLSHCNAESTRRIANGLGQIVTDSLKEHQDLARGTGSEKWIIPSDYLYLYKSHAAFEADGFGWSIRRDHGVKWDELDAVALRHYDPVFSNEIGFGVRMGDHGYISDPGQYVGALANHLRKSGARIIKAEATQLIVEGGKFVGVVAGGERLAADKAVIACGVWSKPLLESLGIKIPMESERGYHLELFEPNQVPRAPGMIASGRFVVTPMDGRIRLSGIVEFGGLDLPPSAQPPALLLRQIKKAMPHLTWSHTRSWLGHRPAPCDSLPFFGAVAAVDGLYTNFGHHHIGLTSGPKTGRILADLMSGKRPNADWSDFRPERFT